MLEIMCISTSISYRIHGTSGIFTYHQHHKKSSSHVGKHISRMHAMGIGIFLVLVTPARARALVAKRLWSSRSTSPHVPSWWRPRGAATHGAAMTQSPQLIGRQLPVAKDGLYSSSSKQRLYHMT